MLQIHQYKSPDVGTFVLLVVTDDQFAAGLLRFIPADRIGKLEAANAEVFKQLEND